MYKGSEGMAHPSSGTGAPVAQASNSGRRTGHDPAVQVVNNNFTNFHSNDQSTLNVSINNNPGAPTNQENNDTAASALLSMHSSNANAGNAKASPWRGASGGNHYSPNATTPTVTTEQIELNEIGLPILPTTLIPVQVSKIDFAYCFQPHIFAYAWAFDKSQRKFGRNQWAKSDEQVNQFVKQLVGIHGEIVQKGRMMMYQKWVDGFREDGFLVNGQKASNLRSVTSIISSRAMRKAFDEDPILPFCYTMKNIYTQSQDASLDLWFNDAMRLWLNTRDGGELKFDFRIREAKIPGTKTSKHAILKIAVSSINDIIKNMRNIEERNFSVSVRTKLPPSMKTTTGRKNKEKADNAFMKGEPPDDNYWMISIGPELNALGFNQININCYLRVIKSRFPQLGPKPSLDDFRKMNRRKPFMYGSMFAHCAIANNISEEDAVKHIEEVYKATINQRTIGQGDYAHCDSIELPYDRPDPTKLYFGSIQAPCRTEVMQPYDTMNHLEEGYLASDQPLQYHEVVQPSQRVGQNDWPSAEDRLLPQQQMVHTSQLQPPHYPNQFPTSHHPMANSNQFQYFPNQMAQTPQFQPNARRGGISPYGDQGISIGHSYAEGMQSPPPNSDYRQGNETDEIGSVTSVFHEALGMGMFTADTRSRGGAVTESLDIHGGEIRERNIEPANPSKRGEVLASGNQCCSGDKCAHKGLPLTGTVHKCRHCQHRMHAPCGMDVTIIGNLVRIDVSNDTFPLSVLNPNGRGDKNGSVTGYSEVCSGCIEGLMAGQKAPASLGMATMNVGQASVGKESLPANAVTVAATNSNVVMAPPTHPIDLDRSAKKKEISTYTETSTNVDREWAQSLVGLMLNIPNNWWLGHAGTTIHQGEIMELVVRSNKPKECVFSIMVEGDVDRYDMRYDAVVKYADREQSCFSKYKLPKKPIFLATLKVSYCHPTILLWI